MAYCPIRVSTRVTLVWDILSSPSFVDIFNFIQSITGQPVGNLCMTSSSSISK